MKTKMLMTLATLGTLLLAAAPAFAQDRDCRAPQNASDSYSYEYGIDGRYEYGRFGQERGRRDRFRRERRDERREGDRDERRGDRDREGGYRYDGRR